MQKIFLVIVFLSVSITTEVSAQSQNFKDLDPARGHYKSLQKLSVNPNESDKELDALKFPFDTNVAERRLSLKPFYLKNVMMRDFKIPDPPSNSSEQTRAELNYLLGLQVQRLDDDANSSLYKANVYYNPRITSEDSLYSLYRSNLFYVGRSIGTWFNPESLPKTADLMAHVWQDASYFIWSFKYKYLRVRPYVLDSAIHNLEETNWAAYPSGHAANSYINAYIYQELAPEFRDVFIKDAYDMAHSREIIGVHYPSDSEASRVLARQFVNKLFRNKEFLKDFEEVKAEWKLKAREDFQRPQQTLFKKKSSTCAKTCE